MDPEWMRVRAIPLSTALAAFRAAEQLVSDAFIEPSTGQCLRLAARGGVSAWDAEFVFVAESLGLPLVTRTGSWLEPFRGRS